VIAAARIGLAIVLAACNLKPPTSTVDPPPLLTNEPTSSPVDEVGSTAPIAEPTPEPTPPSRMRVVIISEDGMRPDAIDVANAPNHMALMREGMVAHRAFTVRPSETLASHASMLSGFAVADHKMNFDRFQRGRGQIQLPTIFSIAREHGLLTAMFVGKQKLWHIAPTDTSVFHYEKPGFFCRTVGQRAARYFESTLPDLMFVHLVDPDNAGHERGWMSPAYMAAVRESDRCLRIILDAIERSGMAASTLVIVTADHGGSGRSHSGRGKDLDRRIPWIVRGPAIPAGSQLDVEVSTADTAVTALSALGLPVAPGMVGVSRFPPPAAELRAQ
jgi:arylsulfatase A-like enzyme